MLREEDIDSALIGKRLTETNTGFCGVISSIYRNPNKVFVVGYRNSVGLQSFSYENIKELLEKSETSIGVRKLVTKKVTVERIYDEIVGVYRLGDLFNVEFVNGSSCIFTEGEIVQLSSNTDNSQSHISDTIGH